MGILKVGAGALKSVLEDQWREYFYCPSMEADVLVKKGENRKSKRSYNTKGSDNRIPCWERKAGRRRRVSFRAGLQVL